MKRIIAVFLMVLMLFTVTGCVGNFSVMDGMTDESNTFHYILVNEGGEWHLHKIVKWTDSSSDALGVITSCCNNRFWASYNTAILYADIPSYLPENCHICE